MEKTLAVVKDINVLEDEELLTAMVSADSGEFLNIDKFKVRKALINLALKTNPQGDDAEQIIEGEKITFWWDGKQDPQTLHMEGVKDSATRSIVLPVVDYAGGVVMSAIDFSYITNNESITIPNGDLLEPKKLSVEQREKVVNGTKWLISNLLNWNSTPLLTQTKSDTIAE